MKNKFLLSIAVGCIGALIAVVIGGFEFIGAFERQTLDLRFRHCAPPAPAASPVCIVDISEESIEDLEPDLGRWPWPRDIHAKVVDYLARDGAKVIAFDVLFSERTARREVDEKKAAELLALADAIKGGGSREVAEKLRAELSLLSPTRGDDALGSVSASAGNVFYAMIFTGASRRADERELARREEVLARTALRQPASRAIGAGALSPEARYDDATIPLPELALNSRGAVHINFNSDPDGPARWTYPVIAYGDRLVPSLPAAAAALYLGVDPRDLAIEPRRLVIGDRTVPLDEKGRFHILYRSIPRRDAVIPFVKVLLSSMLVDAGQAPLVPRGFFKDKLVIIGSSAAGLFDLRATPLSSITPGAEIHYQSAENILSNTFLRRAPAWIGFATALLLALLTSVPGMRLKPVAGVLWTLFVIVSYVAAAAFLFRESALQLEVIAPALAVAVSYLILLSCKYMTEFREKTQIRMAFKRYLSPMVMDEVLSDPSKLRLGGERREVSVLFSDIKAFTTISESMDPVLLASMLNDYLTAMTDCVFRNHGILDKYIGDAVMAEFGAPLPREDHAARACRAARDMLMEIGKLKREWKRPGEFPFECRIGINSGLAVVGNMGSEQLFDYTALGMTVNVAARLEPLCKDFRVACIVSGRTADEAAARDRALVFRKLGRVVLKGAASELEVFELAGVREELSGERTAALELFHRGYDSYAARDFAAAAQTFEEVLALLPGDGPSELYLSLCRALLASPPPSDWTPVYRQESK